MITSNIYSNKISKLRGKQELLQSDLLQLNTELKSSNKKLIALEKAQAFIQQVAKDTQEQIKFIISDLVNMALETCFPDEYAFTVNFDIKYGKTECELLFKKRGIDIDPMSASGGGVVDLTAFALRISIWSLGKSDNCIILDEPLKWLQPRELNRKGLEIIKQLSEKLKLQFIIVTNTVTSEDILQIANKVFYVSQDKKTGISEIKY
jgi:hypothetical protein